MCISTNLTAKQSLKNKKTKKTRKQKNKSLLTVLRCQQRNLKYGESRKIYLQQHTN